jgi:hypothetical protein
MITKKLALLPLAVSWKTSWLILLRELAEGNGAVLSTGAALRALSPFPGKVSATSIATNASARSICRLKLVALFVVLSILLLLSVFGRW